jgi:hypothetical protein
VRCIPEDRRTAHGVGPQTGEGNCNPLGCLIVPVSSVWSSKTNMYTKQTCVLFSEGDYEGRVQARYCGRRGSARAPRLASPSVREPGCRKDSSSCAAERSVDRKASGRWASLVLRIVLSGEHARQAVYPEARTLGRSFESSASTAWPGAKA